MWLKRQVDQSANRFKMPIAKFWLKPLPSCLINPLAKVAVAQLKRLKKEH
jgi:hypothetical protein